MMHARLGVPPGGARPLILKKRAQMLHRR